MDEAGRSVQALVAAQVMVQRAIVAALDIATSSPEHDTSSADAFETMVFEIGMRDPEMVTWMRRGLISLLYHAVRAPEVTDEASQEEGLRAVAATLPAETAEVVLLARSAPLPASAWNALGVRRKQGPVRNEVLMLATAAVLRAAVRRLEDGPARWASLGGLCGVATVGAAALALDELHGG